MKTMENVIFARFFDSADVTKVNPVPNGAWVVFIDAPATEFMVAAVRNLLERGCVVIVRDHHDVPDPRTSREEEIHAAAGVVRELLGSNTTLISDRATDPACSSLIMRDEFPAEPCGMARSGIDCSTLGGGCGGEADPCWRADAGYWIVADADMDGLLAAMKARGIVYPELDTDAEVLDGPAAGMTEAALSPMGWLLVRANRALPPFNAPNFEAEQTRLYCQFAAAVGGDADALEALKERVASFEAMVAEATRLAATATEPLPGVALCDVRQGAQFDLGTLSGALERRPGVKLTAVLKTDGPIAKVHGEQISLVVAKPFQKEINLLTLIPEGFVSKPESGAIFNVEFMIHVNIKVWEDVILPALRSLLDN